MKSTFEELEDFRIVILASLEGGDAGIGLIENCYLSHDRFTTYFLHGHFTPLVGFV